MVSGRKDGDKAERWGKELEDAWYALCTCVQVSLSNQSRKKSRKISLSSRSETTNSRREDGF